MGMTKSDLDDLVSVHGKPSFQPIPSMMVGPTEIRADNRDCGRCGTYFGSALSLSHPVCCKCAAPWPRSLERKLAKVHEVWYRGNVPDDRHVIKACFGGHVGHHPEGNPPGYEQTPLVKFLASFRFCEEAPK